MVTAIGCDAQSTKKKTKPKPSGQPMPAWIEQAIAEQQVVDGIPGYWTDPPADNAPVVQLDAQDFIREFKRDEKATKKKYANKWLEITGPVEDLKPSKYNDYIVLCGLQRTQGDKKVCRESIHFNLIDKQPWKQTSVGSTVTIRGVLHTDTWVCRLDHGTITSEDSNPTREINAVELAQAYLQDAEAAEQEFDGLTVVCRGVVQFCGKDGQWHHTRLAGEGEMHIDLQYVSIGDSEFQKLELGQEVTVIGACKIYDAKYHDHPLTIDAALVHE